LLGLHGQLRRAKVRYVAAALVARVLLSRVGL